MESGAKGCEVCSTAASFELILLSLYCFIWLFAGNWFLICGQVIVSGKLRAQRAKSMKFKDGYIISSGQPVKDYIDAAVRHVLLRQVGSTQTHDRIFMSLIFNLFYVANNPFFTLFQGVLGIKVKIMLDWNPKRKQGPKTPIPDLVTIHAPKEEEEYIQPAAIATTDTSIPVVG